MRNRPNENAPAAGAPRNVELLKDAERLRDEVWELRETIAGLNGILDSRRDVVFRVDDTGTITFANTRFGAVTGIEPQAAIGVPAARCLETIGLSWPLERAGPKADHDGRMPVKTVAGRRWFDWEVIPWRGDGPAALAFHIIGRDVTESKRLEDASTKARAQAEAENAAKSHFLATMSHEIRTPLNGILGMAGLLLKTRLSAEQTTYARALKSSGEGLLRLIDDILDFSKIEAGRLELEKEPVDIRHLVRSIVELLSSRADEKSLGFAWRVVPDVPETVDADPVRLRQIIVNLVGNALKFTETGGVAVTVSTQKDMMEIRVQDTGPGIPQGAAGRIFNDFEQADNGLARKHGGAGLGLAISKRLAEALDGDLTVESEPGHGAVFRLVLPLNGKAAQPCPEKARASGAIIATTSAIEAQTLAGILHDHGVDTAVIAQDDVKEDADFATHAILLADAAAADAILENMGPDAVAAAHRAIVMLRPCERDRIERFAKAGFSPYLIRPVRTETLIKAVAGDFDSRGGKMSSLYDDRAVTPPRPPGTTGPRPGNGTSFNILLAEDDPVNALLARALLEREGHEVVVAHNGAEAIDIFSSADLENFDLVLMDMHMPKVDGLTAARAIRATASGADVPIVALTANAFAEDRKRCIDAGMNDHLVKPLDEERLHKTLNHWVRPRAPKQKAADCEASNPHL